LGDDPCPVDRVDRADLLRGLVRQVVGHRFHDVLAVVEHALDGDVEDVLILQAEHLRGLEAAHLAVRRQHEDADTLLAAHRIFGRAAGVAGGRAEDVQLGMLARQGVLEQVAQQLHRHVLEGQRRAVGQRLQDEPAAILFFQREQWRDLFRLFTAADIAIDLGRIGLADQPAQVLGRDVCRKARQDLEREVGIGQLAPGVEVGAADLRVVVWQVESAVRRQASEQDFGKLLGGGMAAGGDIVHGVSVGG
jgi:hypothetical protein